MIKELAMTDRSIQDWLNELPAHFIPEKAAGMDAVIQLRLTGEQSGDWHIVIRDLKIQVLPGVAPNPRLTLSAASQDILKVLTGQMDGMRAHMQGKLKVSGDMSLAMKLMGLFRT